ncbi:MAG: hypothetical protein ABI273_10720 [Lacunisphaera sp.]
MKIVRCIVPIQQQIDRRRFDHFGSSVLLVVEGKHLLISAAHVFHGKDLWMFGEPENIPFDGISFHATSLDLASAQNDSADIAFAELPDEITQRLKNKGFEPLQMHDTAYISRPSNGRAAFSGFPCTKSDFQIGLQRMKLQPAFVEGSLLSSEELTAEGFEPETHLAIPYRRKEQVDHRTETRITGMEPQGMSGGPVWRFGVDGAPWLAGIGFKFDETREILVGTRIEEIFALLQQQSIERWLARRAMSVHKMVFNLKTGALEEDSGEHPRNI